MILRDIPMDPTPDFVWYATLTGPLVTACGFIIAASVAVKGWKETAALAFKNQREILRLQVLNEARKATADEIRAYQSWLRDLRATYSLFPDWAEDAKERPDSWARLIERLEESVFKKEVDFSRWESRLDEYEALFPETSNLRRFLWLEGSQIQSDVGEFRRHLLPAFELDSSLAPAMARAAIWRVEAMRGLTDDLLSYLQDSTLHSIAGTKAREPGVGSPNRPHLIRKNSLLWIEPPVEEWITSKQRSEPKADQS